MSLRNKEDARMMKCKTGLTHWDGKGQLPPGSNFRLDSLLLLHLSDVPPVWCRLLCNVLSFNKSYNNSKKSLFHTSTHEIQLIKIKIIINWHHCIGTFNLVGSINWINNGQIWALKPYHPCGYPGPRPLDLDPLTAHTPRQPSIYANPDTWG